MHRMVFVVLTVAVWVVIFTATFVGLAPKLAEARAVARLLSALRAYASQLRSACSASR